MFERLAGVDFFVNLEDKQKFRGDPEDRAEGVAGTRVNIFAPKNASKEKWAISAGSAYFVWKNARTKARYALLVFLDILACMS